MISIKNLMEFSVVLKTVINDLNQEEVNYGLIGGFALSVSGIVRSTVVIDLLMLSDDLPKLKTILSRYSYNCVFQNKNISQYVSELKPFGQVDVIHAFREASVGMLSRKRKVSVLHEQEVNVLQLEDIIGLKLQAIRNDPRREAIDRSDIELILKHKHSESHDINWGLIKEYYTLFDGENELQELISKYGLSE